MIFRFIFVLDKGLEKNENVNEAVHTLTKCNVKQSQSMTSELVESKQRVVRKNKLKTRRLISSNSNKCRN